MRDGAVAAVSDRRMIVRKMAAHPWVRLGGRESRLFPDRRIRELRDADRRSCVG